MYSFDSILIYAPKWRDNAAGIKVLYLLCHHLNKKGLNAFIVPVGSQRNMDIPSHLKIRFISEKRQNRAAMLKGRYVVVYSETIAGNPLAATNIIRYFLNYPQLLNPRTTISDLELNLPYTENIRRFLELLKCPNLASPLFIASLDIDEIKHGLPKEEYIALYASKYRRLYGSPRLGIEGLHVVEIDGRGRRSQGRSETLELIARAKALISFENSAVVTEATLSGTPVFLHQNPLTENPIAEFELGSYGVRSLEEFDKVEIRVGEFELARKRFLSAQILLADQLDYLFNSTLRHNYFQKKPGGVRVRHLFVRSIIHKISFAYVAMGRILSRMTIPLKDLKSFIRSDKNDR